MHVLKHNFYCMSPTNSRMLCYVTLQGYITANTQTHADAIAVKQETQADFHKSSKSVDMEGKTKEKLYPLFLSVAQWHTQARVGVSMKFFQRYEGWACQSEVSRAREAVIGKPCSLE